MHYINFHMVIVGIVAHTFNENCLTMYSSSSPILIEQQNVTGIVQYTLQLNIRN